MEAITFESLPQAVTQLFDKLENIERLLVNRASENQPEQERWFDLTELCEYLPDKPVKPTVYGWVHNRTIPSHSRGKKLYFLKSEIDAWLKSGRKKTNLEIAAEAQAPTNRKQR